MLGKAWLGDDLSCAEVGESWEMAVTDSLHLTQAELALLWPPLPPLPASSWQINTAISLSPSPSLGEPQGEPIQLCK